MRPPYHFHAIRHTFTTIEGQLVPPERNIFHLIPVAQARSSRDINTTSGSNLSRRAYKLAKNEYT